jgi:hypothetical protein
MIHVAAATTNPTLHWRLHYYMLAPMGFRARMFQAVSSKHGLESMGLMMTYYLQKRMRFAVCAMYAFPQVNNTSTISYGSMHQRSVGLMPQISHSVTKPSSSTSSITGIAEGVGAAANGTL